MCCRNSLLEELSTSFWIHWEMALLKTCFCFPPDVAPRTLLFADFSLYSFALINPRHEYNYLLNFWSSTSKLLNTGVDLVISDTPGTWIPPSTWVKQDWCQTGEIGFLRQYFSKNVQIKLPYKIPTCFNVSDGEVYSLLYIHSSSRKIYIYITYVFPPSCFKLRMCYLIYLVVISSYFLIT